MTEATPCNRRNLAVFALTCGAFGSILPSVSCVLIDDPSNDPCYFHCWSTDVVLPTTDGVYVAGAACTNVLGGSISIPVPPKIIGRTCLELQSEQDFVNATIGAIQEDDVDSLSMLAHLHWDSFVEAMAADAFKNCITHLTGSPGQQDIDPTLPGKQACLHDGTTIAFCDDLVADVIRDRFDLSHGASTDIPAYLGVVPGVAPESMCSYEPQYGSTGEVDPSSSDGGAADESGSTDGNSGADSSGGETSGFGDVDGRIECSSSTSCTVDASLLRDIADNFATFYAEGVFLQILPASTPCNTAGAVLSGLDAGDDAKALADAIGLRNGDIIALVEGIELSSMDKAADIIDDLSSSSDPISMTVKRRASNSCRSFDLTLTIQ